MKWFRPFSKWAKPPVPAPAPAEAPLEAPKISRCPTCSGAVDTDVRPLEEGGGLRFTHTLRLEEVALALDNEATARAIAKVMPPGLRLAIATVMLAPQQEGDQAYFTTKDVEDEAEARARCLGVVRELRARGRVTEVATFAGLAERHERRAFRILGLLPEDEQLHMKRRMHGEGLSDPAIEVVKS